MFLPASNPRAIAKARISGSDLVVLDLEDAVKQEDKDSARSAAVEVVATDWSMPVAIRVNGAGTPWHSLDVEAVAQSNAAFVIVPRAICGDVARNVAEATGKAVLAMIETAAGVIAAAQIARSCAALIAGTNDLRADLRLPPGPARAQISTALQMVVLASRSAGIACFDGVFNNLDDHEGFLREAEEGRSLGFDGKSLIHPNQIEPCHLAFAPNVAEIEQARALIAAFQGGAERFGSEMIERMHVETAMRLLERVND